MRVNREKLHEEVWDEPMTFSGGLIEIHCPALS